MHVVELGPGRIAEHLAVELGHGALREAQVGRGLQEFALLREESFRALHLQEHAVGGVAPESEELAHGLERRLAAFGALVQNLGELAGSPGPAFENDGVVLQAAAAQGNPGGEHGGELALGVPKIGETRPLRHALERLVHLVRDRQPAARVEDLGQHLRGRIVGWLSGLAALNGLGQGVREFPGGRP